MELGVACLSAKPVEKAVLGAGLGELGEEHPYIVEPRGDQGGEQEARDKIGEDLGHVAVKHSDHGRDAPVFGRGGQRGTSGGFTSGAGGAREGHAEARVAG